MGLRASLTPVVKGAIYSTSTNSTDSLVFRLVWWLNNHGLTPSRDKIVLSSPKHPDKMPNQPPTHFVPAAISFGIKGLDHGSRSWPHTSMWCHGYQRVEQQLHSPVCLHGVDRKHFTIHNSRNFQCHFFPHQEWHMTVAIRTLASPISLQSSSTVTKLMGLGGVKKFRLD